MDPIDLKNELVIAFEQDFPQLDQDDVYSLIKKTIENNKLDGIIYTLTGGKWLP